MCLNFVLRYLGFDIYKPKTIVKYWKQLLKDNFTGWMRNEPGPVFAKGLFLAKTQGDNLALDLQHLSKPNASVRRPCRHPNLTSRTNGSYFTLQRVYFVIWIFKLQNKFWEFNNQNDESLTSIRSSNQNLKANLLFFWLSRKTKILIKAKANLPDRQRKCAMRYLLSTQKNQYHDVHA